LGFDFRSAFAAVILLSGILVVETRHRRDAIKPHPPLDKIPIRLSGWSGRNLSIPNSVVEALGMGDFLSRSYRASGTSSEVSVFVAYYPSQDAGDTLHSPKNCLPGSGWFPLESGRVKLTVTGRMPFEVNRYYVAKGEDRALVFYWYVEDGREIASEYWAKYYLVANAIRSSRSDGAFVRIVAPVGTDRDVSSAEQALIGFSNEFVPVVESYVPK